MAENLTAKGTTGIMSISKTLNSMPLVLELPLAALTVLHNAPCPPSGAVIPNRRVERLEKCQKPLTTFNNTSKALFLILASAYRIS